MRHCLIRALGVSIAALMTTAACGGNSNVTTGAGGGSTAGGGGSHAGGGAQASTSTSTSSSGGGGAGAPAGTSSSSGTGGGPDSSDWGHYNPKEMVSPNMVVDQFGYLTSAEKIAVLRAPQTGFDAGQAYTPSATYAVIDAATSKQVLTGAATPWGGGAEDMSSGDKAWWFDFSKLTTPGDYYILDVDHGVRSYVFRVADTVYRDVLKQAVRMLFYQRAGFEKKAAYAGAGWADGASHVGPLQDSHCRLYSAKDDATTEKDLHGGWYDAGDFNKYTSWAATYVLSLLHAYAENPAAFSDDTGIPESGNGVADVLDEARWGMDWLTRMQNSDGSVLSIVGLSGASPPSSATGQSLYGSASTTATLGAAGAFAYGSRVFRALGKPELTTYADDLASRAQKAWAWAEANPSVLFYNNDAAHGTAGLGSGQQETDDYGRLSKKLEAAVYLFETAGAAEPSYKQFVDTNYGSMHLLQWSLVYPFEGDQQHALLYYASLPGATPSVADKIKSVYAAGVGGDDNLKAFYGNTDPYLAHLKDYTWGSNSTKSTQGSIFADLNAFGVGGTPKEDADRAAQRYLHYLHGVNPLALVYLSNMYDHGAENSVNEFFHTWFADGSASWDRVGTSKYGPPPGFLTGGPNPSYDWDGCCPAGCGSAQSNAICMAESIAPPKGQPAQKSYKDFNTSWPLDSWSVTEPSNGYQTAYIRLLSKYVK